MKLQLTPAQERELVAMYRDGTQPRPMTLLKCERLGLVGSSGQLNERGQLLAQALTAKGQTAGSIHDRLKARPFAELARLLDDAENRLDDELPGTALVFIPPEVSTRADVVAAVKRPDRTWEALAYPFDSPGRPIDANELALACVLYGKATALVPKRGEQIALEILRKAVNSAFDAIPEVRA